MLSYRNKAFVLATISSSTLNSFLKRKYLEKAKTVKVYKTAINSAIKLQRYSVKELKHGARLVQETQTLSEFI